MTLTKTINTETGEQEQKLKLYEYTEQYENLASILEDNPDLDIAEALEGIQESAKEKVSNTAGFIKKLENDLLLIKNRQDELKELKNTKQKQIDGMKDYLLVHMQRMDIQKLDTGTQVVKIRNNAPKLVIGNEDKVPEEFKQYTTTLSVAEDKLPAKWKKMLTESSMTVDKRELTRAIKLMDSEDDKSYESYALLEENKTLNIK